MRMKDTIFLLIVFYKLLRERERERERESTLNYLTIVCVLDINPDSHEIKRYLIIKSIQIVVDIYKRHMHGEEY